MNGLSAWVRAVRHSLYAVLKSAPPPQLQMWYRKGDALEERNLPAGYQLRPYRLGDEDAWTELLNDNGELGAWDRDRIQREVVGDLVNEAQFFVVRGEELVATSGLYNRNLDGTACWEIGWIATHPQHQGKGLGCAVVAASLRSALERGGRSVFLRTDDFRLPALKLYLKLGFIPDYSDTTYGERWRAIFEKLGQDYAIYNVRQEE